MPFDSLYIKEVKVRQNHKKYHSEEFRIYSIDTTINIKEVNICYNRFQNFSSGNKVQKIEPVTIRNFSSGNISDLLKNYTSLYVRSYGISGLTNISVRGSNSNHTAVLWNGINLQDPLNGGVNLLLLPVGTVDEISIQYGGSGALFGSGAVGGVIMLENTVAFNKGISTNFSAGLGSFGKYFGSAGIKLGLKKYAGAVRFFYDRATNDFPFINTQQFGKPELRQQNAAYNQYGFTQENSFYLSRNQKINTYLWYQTSYREIPISMSTTSGRQSQEDDALRISANWSFYGNIASYIARIAYLNNSLIYDDPEIGVYSKHLSNTKLAEFETNIKICDNHLLNIGLNNRLDVGKSADFLGDPKRISTALFIAYRIRNTSNNFETNISIREELTDSEFGQPTPALSFRVNILPPLQVHGKVSGNYRVPTFNDSYWYGGFAMGNPDLVPENGWSEDIGLQLKTGPDLIKTDCDISFYNSRINDLILWMPIEGIWMPVNKKEVWSRGFELSSKNSLNFTRTIIGFDGKYTNNHSTLERKSKLESDAVLHKQMVNTPVHQGNLRFYIEQKRWQVDLIWQLVGKRYIMADNSGYLDPYNLLNVILSCNPGKGKSNWFINLHLNNILGKVYQSMPNYAMPKQNYQLTVQYKFN